MYTIRPAVLGDLETITEIYNDAIRTTTATFDTIEKGYDEQREWFESHGSGSPILVAETSGGVAGWACLSPWADRCAFKDTAETSIYLAPEARGHGLGRKLLSALIEAGRVAGHHVLICRIAEGNDASLNLHYKLGFKPIGTMRQVGQKFGRRWDVHMAQMMLSGLSADSQSG